MGGKRKSAKRVVVKKKATVARVFKCPYCAHDSSCEVKFDRATETGRIACRVCGEDFQCRISYLSDPVDVYCEWIDACEAARDGAVPSSSSSSSAAATDTVPSTTTTTGITNHPTTATITHKPTTVRNNDKNDDEE